MKALRENFNGIVICLFELVIGILLLIDPIGFTSGIIITAGILLILTGLINCIKYFITEAKEASKGRFMTKGLIAVLAGAFCILNTDWFIVTFSALTVIYGIIVLLASVEKIQLCMDLLRQKRKKWYLAAFSAIISLVCAVIILKNPFSSSTLIWIVAGISLILESMFDMYTLLENCRKQEEKVVTKEVNNEAEEEKKAKINSEKISINEANATVENDSYEINSAEGNVNNGLNSASVTSSYEINSAEVNKEYTESEGNTSEDNSGKKKRGWRRKEK